MTNLKTVVASHLLVFAAGVFIGRGINAEELNAYRVAHESVFDRIRRRAGQVTAGVAVVVTLALTAKAARSV